MKCLFFQAIIALTLFAMTSHAHADEPRVVFLPGAAREISRSSSASRDTPIVEGAYGPRTQMSLGAEPGFSSCVVPTSIGGSARTE